MNQRPSIVRFGLNTMERKIGVYCDRERGGYQPWLPSAIPGAYHYGDGEDHQAAFHQIGKQ